MHSRGSDSSCHDPDKVVSTTMQRQTSLLILSNEVLAQIFSYLFSDIHHLCNVFHDERENGLIHRLQVNVLRVCHTIHDQAVEQLKKSFGMTKLWFEDCLPVDIDQAISLLRHYGGCFPRVIILGYQEPRGPSAQCRQLLRKNIAMLKGAKVIELTNGSDHNELGGPEPTELFEKYHKHTWEQWIDPNCESANKAIVEEVLRGPIFIPFDKRGKGWWSTIKANAGEREFKIHVCMRYHTQTEGRYVSSLVSILHDSPVCCVMKALTFEQRAWVNIDDRTIVRKRVYQSDWMSKADDNTIGI